MANGDPSFEQELLTDVAASQEAQTEQAGALGAAPIAGGPQITSFQIGQKAIGQKELGDNARAIELVAKTLSSEATNLSTAEQARFQSDTRQALNSLRLELAKRAADLNFELGKQKLSLEKKKAIFGAIGGGITAGLTSAIGFGGGK